MAASVADRPVVCITQARVGSTRLPAKVLRPIAGRPLLWWHLTRLLAVRGIDRVIVATTFEEGAEKIAEIAESLGVTVFRGPVDDVLARFEGAAALGGAATVMRVTSDCPLIDPGLLDSLIELYLAGRSQLDYASIDIGRLPRGLDAEIFTRSALDEAASEAKKADDREHVTRFIWRQPERYRLTHYAPDGDFGRYRLCVDTEADFQLVTAIIGDLGGEGPYFGWESIRELLEARPDLVAINAHVEQKHV